MYSFRVHILGSTIGRAAPNLVHVFTHDCSIYVIYCIIQVLLYGFLVHRTVVKCWFVLA